MALKNEVAAAFVNGYITAVTNIVMLHGETTYATDLLVQLGRIDWRRIDAYDRKILREAGVIRDLKRQLKRPPIPRVYSEGSGT